MGSYSTSMVQLTLKAVVVLVLITLGQLFPIEGKRWRTWPRRRSFGILPWRYWPRRPFFWIRRPIINLRPRRTANRILKIDEGFFYKPGNLHNRDGCMSMCSNNDRHLSYREAHDKWPRASGQRAT